MDLIYMVIILITIFLTDVKGIIYKQMNQINLDMEEILYTSQNEQSMLQCAHKCRLIDKGAAIVFRDSECQCVKYIKGDGKDLKNESTSGVYVNQVIKKEVHGCDKTSKGGCSDICNKDGDAVVCSCQEGYGIIEDGLTCKKMVNVALGKYTQQSSTFYLNPPHSFTSSSDKAVDGRIDSISLTRKEANQWWEVNLGEVKLIMEIHLTGPIYNLSYNQGLIISTTRGNDWVVCKDIGAPKESTLKLKCDLQPTYANRIRIHQNEKCLLQFREVEIFSY